MKNPLRHRLLRELKSEFGKYLVIFLLLTGTIGMVSGFLVADESLMTAYHGSFVKYRIEDGNFRTSKKMNEAQKKTVAEAGVSLYDNFYVEEELTNGSTIRIFKNREEVNLVCLMQGAFPQKEAEIAIDRMYAENNDISIGDTLSGEGKEWKVTGLAALPDYSCLFSDNSDSMFDAVKFGVAVVTGEEFADLGQGKIKYSYSWEYDEKPSDEKEEKEKSDELMKEIAKTAALEAYVPQYLNQAIQFTGDDMGSDRAMMIVLLYVIIVIMAFVFGITVSNTVSKEAGVIGTLRASGYTRRELAFHYMTAPVLVTVAGALLGNLLGYTVFEDVCAGLYYNSYSLTTYELEWNADAFFLTTIIPLLMMFVINYGILRYKLVLPPLKFLRRDLSRKRQKKAAPLSVRIRFFHRFRLRVIFQNISNYVILLVGILFANLLLMFGLLLPAILEHYQEEMEQNMFCKYQYMLQAPLDALSSDSEIEKMIELALFVHFTETDNEDAENFSAYSLNTLDGKYKNEEIALYGIQEDSQYIPADVSDGKIYISSGYAKKYGVKVGDTIYLQEKYEDKEYSFQIDGIYDYEGGLSVFMAKEELNEAFGLGKDYFSGYFSDTEITDIDEQYISSVIDIEDLTKISRQLVVSMGGMMNVVNAFAVIMFMVLIYLLSKIVIEKNAQSISMAKILGYTDKEISRLYIAPTTIMVVLFLLISLPAEYYVMRFLFIEMIMRSITGWITFYVDPYVYVKMFALGIATYAAVAALEYRKICKVPMDEALKNVE